MGTREVYEEKLRSGNLRHEPTINPGLGSARCLSLINPNSGNGEWTLNPVLHDATSVAGTGVGGMLSAVHGFNTASTTPIVFCGCAAFGGYAVPEFAQLSVTSYYASSSASHYAISRITRFVEEAHLHGWQDYSRDKEVEVF